MNAYAFCGPKCLELSPSHRSAPAQKGFASDAQQLLQMLWTLRGGKESSLMRCSRFTASSTSFFKAGLACFKAGLACAADEAKSELESAASRMHFSMLFPLLTGTCPFNDRRSSLVARSSKEVH